MIPKQIIKKKAFPSSGVIRFSGKLNPRLKGKKPYFHVAAQRIRAVPWYFPPCRTFQRGSERGEVVCYCPFLCRFSLCGSVLSCPGAWQTIYDSSIIYNAFLLDIRVMMPLMRLLTWMHIYHRNKLLARHPMILVVSGYNQARNSFMSNPDQREQVPASLCENISLSLSKDSVPNLRDFIVI